MALLATGLLRARSGSREQQSMLINEEQISIYALETKISSQGNC